MSLLRATGSVCFGSGNERGCLVAAIGEKRMLQRQRMFGNAHKDDPPSSVGFCKGISVGGRIHCLIKLMPSVGWWR
ncbi:hypothetical protein CEXT_154541 [Caerostris extrusa]|uniref:Uncharacterized protein n=1 Tax=Caerostris extrusa TaxID=172846 RepID=A0AAV4QC59_CAEEX|nr:hypothetical protein CEXT_154541 [Caerostris extrusa]